VINGNFIRKGVTLLYIGDLEKVRNGDVFDSEKTSLIYLKDYNNAMELIDSSSPDIVFAEKNGGVEFVKEALLKYPNIHYVVAAERKNADELVSALESGAETVVAKPFDLKKLQENIKSIYERIYKNNLNIYAETLSGAVSSFTSDGYAICDQDGRLVSINSIGCEILDMEKEKILGSCIHLLLGFSASESDCSDGKCTLCSYLHAGEVFVGDFEKINIGNGKEKYIEISCTPIFTDNRLSGSISVFREISKGYINDSNDLTPGKVMNTISSVASLMNDDDHVESAAVSSLEILTKTLNSKASGVMIFETYHEDIIPSANLESKWSRDVEGELLLDAFSLDNIEDWHNKLMTKEFIIHETDIFTGIIVPVKVNSNLRGIFFVLDNGIREWDFKEIELLKTCSELIRKGSITCQTEQELVESKEFYQSVINTSLSGFILFDSSGKVIDVNEAFMRMTGYSKESLEGKDISHMFEGKYKELYKHQVEIRPVTKYRRFELRGRTENLEDVDLDISETTIRNSEGVYIAAFAFVNDITLRNKRVKELKKANIFLDSYKKALDESVAVIKFQPDGHIIYGNRQIQEILENSNLVGDNFFRIWHTDENKLKNSIMMSTAAGVIWSGTLEKTIDGKDVFLDTKIVPVSSENGKADEFICVGNNITELRNLIEASKKAEKAKSLFLANMSHEIRTPLHGIMGFLEMLSDTGLKEHQRRYLDIIQSNSETLLTIINDILDFSKIEQRKLHLEKAPFDPISCFEGAAGLFILEAEEKNVKLSIFADPLMPKALLGDSLRMKQIVVNLISNAVKFTPKGGKVSASLKLIREDRQSCRFRVEIKDTGIGISPEDKEIIFEAFNQADISVTRKYGGTGLGLPICVNILELLNSELVIDSNPGHGSTFSFDLRLDKVADESDNVDEYVIPLKVHILNEDKNDENIQLIDRYLAGLCCETSHGRVEDDIPENTEVVICLSSEIYIEKMKNIPSDMNKIVFAKMRDDKFEDEFEQFASILKLPVSISKLKDFLYKNTESGRAKQKAVKRPRIDYSDYKVLVVDDNPVSRRLARLVLEEMGMTVDLAENGLEAVEKFKSSKYDFTLMDIQMPILNGVEAAKQIFAYERENDLEHKPLFSMTANAMKEDLDSYLDIGMDDNLVKPFSKERLVQFLDKYLG